MPEINIPEEVNLPKAARAFLKLAGNHRLFAIYGEMGAGKTSLIKAICKELGVQDAVSSPTFALVYEYLTAAGEPVYHFDFYRLDDVQEAMDIGFEEYLYSEGWVFIEWPEPVEGHLPEGCVPVLIRRHEDGTRTVDINLPS